MGYHYANIEDEDRTEGEKRFYAVTTAWSEWDMKRLHASEAYSLESEGHKVLRWTSNDAVVPDDIIEATDWQYQDEHKAARYAETSKFIAEYKERMKDHVPSAEEQFEMRAAFGPGQTVVNSITGKKYRT